MADKAALRQKIRAWEGALPREDKLRSDEILRRRLLQCPLLEGAKTVLLFAGMGAEVDTAPLLKALEQHHKRVLLPRCLPGQQMEARLWQPDGLVRHRYGMLEPDEDSPRVAKEEIDLILVPALCYDRRGYRLGRGGGYYDRYLSDYSGVTLGLCRDALLQAAVPVEPWDRPVELVLTETATYGRRALLSCVTSI